MIASGVGRAIGLHPVGVRQVLCRTPRTDLATEGEPISVRKGCRGQHGQSSARDVGECGRTFPA